MIYREYWVKLYRTVKNYIKSNEFMKSYIQLEKELEQIFQINNAVNIRWPNLSRLKNQNLEI